MINAPLPSKAYQYLPAHVCTYPTPHTPCASCSCSCSAYWLVVGGCVKCRTVSWAFSSVHVLDGGGKPPTKWGYDDVRKLTSEHLGLSKAEDPHLSIARGVLTGDGKIRESVRVRSASIHVDSVLFGSVGFWLDTREYVYAIAVSGVLLRGGERLACVRGWVGGWVYMTYTATLSLP